MSETPPSPAPRGVPPAPQRADPWLLALAGATLAFFVATASGYGIFRDELYYLANGRHLGFGYVEHPPLIGVVAAATQAVLGDSLHAIRFPPALAAAVTVWLAGWMAAGFGGRRYAQLLAGLAVLASPHYLGNFSLFTMNAFDIALWALAFGLAQRALAGGGGRWWVVFGLVAGIGLENKISVLFLGAGLAIGLVIARRWDALRSRGLWIGGALAVLLFLPYVLWQAAHGWPLLEFMENARRLKNVHFSPLAFLGAQMLLITGPHLTPVWIAGLLWLLVARAARPWRALGWTFLAVAVLMMAAGGAKPYYLAPAYPPLLAAGAALAERWTAGRGRPLWRAAVAVWLVTVGALLAPLGKALLPVETLVRYQAWLGVRAGAEERHEMGRLPQHFADMHGWRELAETVAEVYRRLPPAEQARACIFGQNYGEAGAIDHFGPRLGLPRAISGHNSYYLWGPGDCTGEVVIVIGDDRETLEGIFGEVEQAAVFRCRDCMPYESDLPIWVARRMRMPFRELWPRIKAYI